MRAVLFGSLSVTLLCLLAGGTRIVAGRRQRVQAPTAPGYDAEAPPVVAPLAHQRRYLPSVTTGGCTPRTGWACWRGRLTVSGAVRAAWLARRAQQRTERFPPDAPAEADQPTGAADDADDTISATEVPLPPAAPFDRFFSVRVVPLDDDAPTTGSGSGGISDGSRAIRWSHSEEVAADAVVSLSADGTFEIQVPPGRYTIEAVSKDRVLTGGRDGLRAVAGAAEDGVDIALARTVELSGRIVDEDGIPMTAALTLTRVGGPASQYDAFEGSEEFTFEDLRAGSFRLTAETKDGHTVEAIFRAPLAGITLRVPRPQDRLLVFPRAADGTCSAPQLVMAQPVSAAASPPGPRSAAGVARPRPLIVEGCQAILGEVAPGSVWQISGRTGAAFPARQIHLDAGGLQSPVCVGDACAMDGAALALWLLDASGRPTSLPVTLNDADGSPPLGVDVTIGGAITGLRAGHSITVRVELDTGAVTQQVLLSPGVNRAVIHVPTTGEIHEGTID